jgi:archaellum component FlaD/FlaE
MPFLWPLSKDSHTKRRFIDHMVVVECSEELEEMIENDVMEKLERRVRNRINEMQGV